MGENGKTRRTVVVACLKAAALLALLGAGAWLALVYSHHLRDVFSRLDEFKQEVLRWGAWGPLAYVALQVIQIVVFIIPGELTQAAGGAIFGPWVGTLWGFVGALLGTACAFLLADALGRPLVRVLLKPATFERLETALNARRGHAAIFVLFLIPGLPKDALSYVAGLTPIRFWPFVLISSVARLPGILLSSFLGSSIVEQHYTAFFVFAGISLALLVLGLVFGKRVERWMTGKNAGGSKLAG